MSAMVGSLTQPVKPRFHVYVPGEPCKLKTFLMQLRLPVLSQDQEPTRDRKAINKAGEGCLVTIIAVTEEAKHVNEWLKKGDFTTGDYVVYVMLNSGYVMPLFANDLEPL